MSVAVYNHYKRIQVGAKDQEVELQKSNILILGPTGVRQDLPGPDAREDAGLSQLYRRRHRPHRGRLASARTSRTSC